MTILQMWLASSAFAGCIAMQLEGSRFIGLGMTAIGSFGFLGLAILKAAGG